VKKPRLAILTSHPIQYYAPLFRALAKKIDLHVFYAHRPEDVDQAAVGYGKSFSWDTDLLSGYQHSFLKNVARHPVTSSYFGSDTPEVGSRLREGTFTHVLSLGWNLKSYQQGILAAKSAGMIVMVRGDSQLVAPRSPLKKLAKAIAYPVLLKVFDAVLYVGSLNRDYYLHYRYPKERMFFSPHAVDNEHFASGATKPDGHAVREGLGISQSSFVVLFVGRLVEFKHPEHVLEVVAALRKKEVDAIAMFAGSGALNEELLRRAKSLDVPVHLLGLVNQSKLPATYAAADVLMLPSTGHETWGLVCNEALAARTPILVADTVGCSRDLAIDGVVGRTYPFADVQRAADKLMQIVDSPPPETLIRELSEKYDLAAAAEGVLQAVEKTKWIP
jgi:glycosyltransferase involved in cell wall biosynthesis